jgi:hypothetical protein
MKRCVDTERPNLENNMIEKGLAILYHNLKRNKEEERM